MLLQNERRYYVVYKYNGTSAMYAKFLGSKPGVCYSRNTIRPTFILIFDNGMTSMRIRVEDILYIEKTKYDITNGTKI